MLQNGAILGDGKYEFDYSGLSETNRLASHAFKLMGNAKIMGSAPDKVDIGLTNIRFLEGAILGQTNPIYNVENAKIAQKYTLASKVNIVWGGPYYMKNVNYNIASASGNRARFETPLYLTDSALHVNIAANPNSGFGIILATDKYSIKNSAITTQSGIILLDKGVLQTVSGSTIKADGIQIAKSPAPHQPDYFGDVTNEKEFTFTQNPNIGYVSFEDDKSNRYEISYPAITPSASKTIPYPGVILTFQSEDGSKTQKYTLIKGTSLDQLSGIAIVDGAPIDKTKLNAFEASIGADIDFEYFVDGDTSKPYTTADQITENTTVVLKAVTDGVRYYLNDGSANHDKYIFVRKNDGQTTPLTLAQVIAKNAMFKQHSKVFKGWTLDPAGNTPAGSIDPNSSATTNLYAKWENKKAFNVTYYRNKPDTTSVANPEVVNVVLYEGDHLAGILVDSNKKIHLINNSESEGNRFITSDDVIEKGYYQKEFAPTYGPWYWLGSYGLSNILSDNYTNLYRTQGWNTASDGSGTYYRGGHTLTAEDFEKTGGNLVLYDQWVELETLKKTHAAAIADPQKARPNIKLSAEQAPAPSDYETASGALVVDHSQTLNYYAYLNFEKLRTELVTLWGRINEVTEWSGTMNAYFDSRLVFDKNIKLLFESTWQVPDMTKLEQYGVTDVQQVPGKPTQWIFTIKKEFLTNNLVSNRQGTDTSYDSSGYKYYKADLPVKIIPKYDPNGVDFQKLSYEDFMKPMVLTVYDSYGKGINAYITKESANKIALSDKPVIIVGGDIQMNINGFERQGFTLLKYKLKSNAYDEHAKLYPSGIVHAKYEKVNHTDYTNVLEALTNPDTNNFTDSKEGRALNDKLIGDVNNFAEQYHFAIPNYAGLDLVAIKLQVQKTDANGNYEVNQDGTPKYTETVYADTFYTNKAGSLAEGKALLQGDFLHSQITTYVLQYAVPTGAVRAEYYIAGTETKLQDDKIVLPKGTAIGTAYSDTPPSQIIKDGKTYKLVTNQDGTPILKAGSAAAQGNVEAEEKVIQYQYVLAEEPAPTTTPMPVIKVPQTGDNTNIALYAILMLVAAIAFAAIRRAKCKINK